MPAEGCDPEWLGKRMDRRAARRNHPDSDWDQWSVRLVSRVNRFAHSLHCHNVSVTKIPVQATAPDFLCLWLATMAPTSDILAMPVSARTIGSDLGSRDQDSSPRIARVANEDML